MPDRYDLLVPRTGRYDKTYFTKIGVAFASRQGDGFNLSFDALPVPNKDGDVRVVMMPPRDNDGGRRSPAPARSQGRAPASADLDDSIPF